MKFYSFGINGVVLLMCANELDINSGKPISNCHYQSVIS
jgi:hypothetical protein